ncbi:MAG: hypothetical protein NVSMB21_17280 [Vulcanimicrobiaceae bacterium]
MRYTRALALAATVALGGAAASAATSTPEPGGANGHAGVSGTLHSVLFNGRLRLRAMAFRNPVGNDWKNVNAPTDRPIIFTAIVSNGMQRSLHGFFKGALADANGVTVEGRPTDDGWSFEQGAAARIKMWFSVPADFVPVRLVLTEEAVERPKAFRIAIAPSDFPAASTAATPAP